MNKAICVEMPIQCIGKLCMSCPELTIVTDHMDLTNCSEHIFLNSMRCAHLDKCLNIVSAVEDNMKKGE